MLEYMYIESLYIHGCCDSIVHSDMCSWNTNNLVPGILNNTDVHQPAHQRSQVSVVSVWSLLSIKSKFSL